MIGHFAHKPSGCYWYRIKQPMDMLNSNGIKTQLIHVDEDVVNFDELSAFQFYGAYPFSMEKVLKSLKESGKHIVYDTDDALDLIDTSNPFYYSVKKDLGSVNEILTYADEITVSTKALAEYVRTKTDKKITVIPNSYTPSEWIGERPKREGIRIGFAGSSTHVKDLIDIIPVIEKLQKKYPITFIIQGFGLGNDYKEWFKEFRYLATPEAQKLLIELDNNLSRIDFEWVPYIDFDKYPTSLRNMALDIGICPLKETPFDRCRSACKAMEYTLSGALALASDTEPYRGDLSSVLVRDDEWEKAIENYIVFPERRNSEHQTHLKWLQENRSIEKQLEPLKEVYKQ